MDKNTEQKTIQYILPYKTGEEMRAALKNNLFQTRDRILIAYPNIKEEYEKRAAYSKYSVDNVTLSAVFPSFVRYLSIRWKKPKMYNKIPKIVEKYNEGYKEYVFDSDDNLLMIKSVYQETIRNILYAVNFDGCQYIFNIDNFFEVDKLDANDIFENPSITKAYCYVGRTKYENGKLIQFEEYSSSYFSVKDYYSEIYYTIDEKEYCTSQEGMFKGDDKLPATDKQSSVSTHIYRLSFNNRQLEQIDEVLLPDGQIETIFPQKPKTPSGLPKTKASLKALKQRLTAVGYSAKNGIVFKTFWKVFKEFVFNDKFDCAEETLLWEPTLTSNRRALSITRQFSHNNAYGVYEYMEQFSVEFDIPYTQSTENPFEKTFSSEGDFAKFFEKVEQTDEFKSSNPETLIKLSMYFGEV